MPHSLGSPTAAKITDKLTYKEFLFCEKTPKVSSRAAGTRDAPATERKPFQQHGAQAIQLPKVPKWEEDSTAMKDRVPDHGQVTILSLRS